MQLRSRQACGSSTVCNDASVMTASSVTEQGLASAPGGERLRLLRCGTGVVSGEPNAGILARLALCRSTSE